MDKNTVYILQKDCLDAKAGDEFEFSESSDCYSKIGGDCQIDYLSALFVENNPEWFKPKEEVNESKPTEQFQWTDELVKEMVSFLAKLFKWNKEQSIGFSEQFKKSKSKKEEPQWEILQSYNGDVNVIHNYIPDNNIVGSESCDSMGCKIFSVKRFPDNTVWSVDDDTQHGKISGFKIAGSTMIAEIKNTVFPYDYPLYLSELKPPKETPKPEWEILEIECYGGEKRRLVNGEYRIFDDGIGWTWDELSRKKDTKILSVKRLSDGEVFSVGDVIKVHTDIKPIVSFELKNNKQIWCSIDNAKGYGSCLSVSEKAPKGEQVPISIDDREMFSINDIGSCYSSPKDSPLYNQFIIELYQLLCKKINNQSLNK